VSTRDRSKSSRTSIRPSGGRTAELAARVRELADGYQPPDFAEAPSADAALFLCAIDHRSGYAERHAVDGESLRGSALLWALGCAAERRQPGLLSAETLAKVDAAAVEALVRIEGESVADPGTRASLWRDLAAGLKHDYGGSAAELLSAADSRLGGDGGLIERLSAFEAFSDPLAKKAFLFAKIAARRGWLTVADPESWEVCADNVLMRLALRSALVAPAPVEELRAVTRSRLKEVAERAELEPPLLDDLLWELGRENPDLLGTEGGADLHEPPRPQGTTWYSASVN
jgi:hypothetical protein